MNHDETAYGLWLLVLVNSAVFIIFAFSFTKPQSKRDWHSLGGFSPVIVSSHHGAGRMKFACYRDSGRTR